MIQVIDRLLFLFFIFQFFAKKKKKRINNTSVTIHRTISLPFLPLSTYVPCTRKTTLNAFPRSQAAINISRYAVWVSYRNTGVQTTSERTYSSHIFIEKRLDKTRLRVARLIKVSRARRRKKKKKKKKETFVHFPWKQSVSPVFRKYINQR